MTKLRRIKKIEFPGVSKADIHIHTCLSDGMPNAEEVVDYVVKRTDLSVIAITDHDDVKGAYEAQKIVKKKGYSLDVIIGEEVTTRQGHIIALFIKDKIRNGLSAKEAIKEIHKQGGIAIAAHPMHHYRIRSPKYGSMNGVGAVNLIREDFDAVETINAAPTLSNGNKKTKYLNRKLLFKAEVGGSDAHILKSIGMGYTLFDGKTAKDLRDSIEKSQSQAYSYSWKWNMSGLLFYGIYMLPKVIGNALWCMKNGFSPRKPGLIRLPRDFK